MATESEPKAYGVVIGNYEQLVNTIPVEEVLRKLLTKRVINLSDKQIIMSEKSDVKRAEHLLDNHIMHHLSAGEDRPFLALLDAMRETGKCDNLVKDIYKELGEEMLQNNVPKNLKWGNLLEVGSFGKVYQCYCEDTGEEIAAKVIEIHPNSNEKELVSLEKEINMLKNLQHDRIVVYHGTRRTKTRVNVFMEYMSGGSLRKFLSNHGPLNENLTRRYTRQLLEGVKYLHSRNIVHRDIKGDNVLRDSKGNIKIADFGTSKHLQTIHFSEAKANTFTGTWHWMAPEVFKCQPINTKSDIWSVGCTVFEMLTGKPPFYELSQYQLMCLITNDNHLDIQLPPHCSTAAHDFVASCLRKDVSSRPSAVELLCHEFVTSAAPKRVATEPADIRPQAASTIDSGKGAVTDAVLTDIKRTVCRIRSPLMVATGFIAYVKSKEGFNLALVTNNHVIRTADEAMASRITFENVFPDHKVTLKGFQIFLKEKNAFRCSRETELDYTIIEIDETKMKDPETGKRLDIEPIYLMYPADIRTDDQIYVIQHPRGGKLTFSPSQCTVIEPLLLYECTTDMGSSGSPVLKEVDGDLKIVALHRGGEYKQWNSDRYNCGTLIQEIVNHLNGKLRLRFPQRPMTSHHGMSSQYTQPTLRTPQDGIPQQPSSAFGREPHLIYQPSSTIGGRMGQVYDENMLESNVSSVSQEPADIRPQAVLPIDSGKGAVTDAVLTDIKRTVCRIHSLIMVATGFIAYVNSKEELNMALVTNNHVIRTADEAMVSRITFENVFPDRKVTLKGFHIFSKEKDAFRCSRETELDYTIIEIDETKMKDPETGKRLDIEPIYLMYPADIKTDDQIYVIQHPHGGKLTFSPSQCTVIEPLLLYECRREIGSSGSPILKEMDGDLKVVALHRGGEYKQWNSDGFNCGTLIQEIVNHLNGQQCLRLPTRDQVQQALRRR